MNTVWIFLLVLIALAVWVFAIYNRLVTLRNRFKNGFSQIDVQLKRRYDLIPNLIETAKGYLAHERETLEAVIKARNAAVSASERAAADPTDPEAMGRLIAAESGLGGVLGKLFALQEGYPELKADGAMRDLMEELGSTENRIAFARQAFNDAVMAYNTAIEIFPNVLLAGPLNFRSAPYFTLDDPAQGEAPQVSF